uniref:Uncharacterized protein n=1 Tax=Anguilla anguilla TaxID=7936 RepID=A0A0E9S5Y7_ANGAN
MYVSKPATKLVEQVIVSFDLNFQKQYVVGQR